MKKYTVVQVGLGNRGITHLKGFACNTDRIEVVGICDVLPERVESVGNEFGIPSEKRYADAETMLQREKPDILSFCTLPDVRIEMVELAVKYGVKGLFFEKPMATSLDEAKRITDLCEKNGIKAVVCHQHKYFGSFRKLREILDSGELGEVERINAECQPWLSQLGTHYMDYVIWANGGIGPVSVVGHVHGKDLLSDSHPSPDYFLGEAVMKNGVRCTLQFGYFTRCHREHDENYETREYPIDFWEDDRLTVYGTTGYAWAECNGHWGAFTAKTGGKVIGGKTPGFRDEIEHPLAQDLYTKDFIAWMDGTLENHPCNVAQAFEGYQALEAMGLSALDQIRVDLPMNPLPTEDINCRMAKELPEQPRRKF